MVVPPFAALFPDTTLKVVGNLTPVSGAMLMHLLNEKTILFFSPGPFNHFWVENFLPAMETLHISPVFEAFSDTLPVFRAHLFDELSKFFVLKVILLVREQILFLQRFAK